MTGLPAESMAAAAANNGSEVADGNIPGPVTQQLTNAYAAFVNCDFVAQYLAQLQE